MTIKRLPILFFACGLLGGAWSHASVVTLDEANARTAITQSPEFVLAAVVEVETRCHAQDQLCLDGVRVVQVLLQRNPAGTVLKVGDRITLHVGAGTDAGLPATGDRVLVVAWPLDAKDSRSDYTAKAMTIAPSRKDIDELRSVIEGLVSKPAP